MTTVPAPTRTLFLALTVLLLACPGCGLGSRGAPEAPPETVVWATVVTAAATPTATLTAPAALQPTAHVATTTAEPAPSPTGTSVHAAVPSATIAAVATSAPPASPAPSATATPRRSPGVGGSVGGRKTPSTSPSPTLVPTAAASATSRPRMPQEPAPELRPEMLGELGARPVPRNGNLADLNQLHPLLKLRPELADTGAPDWLHEGTRVLYQAMSATLVGDPNEPGASGAGLLQYDLVALDAGSAVSSVKFLLDAGTGGYTPSLVLYSLGVPGSGEYWVHPDGLKDAEALAHEELVVTRGPTQAAGATYNAVRFEYRPAGAEYVWMFDETSGLLLFYRHAIDLGNRKQQSSSMSLVSVRQLDVPWAGAVAPDWARQGATFAYSGEYTPIISGVGPTPLEYAVQFRVRMAQERWWLCDVGQQTTGTPGNQSQRLSGASQLADALWIPPAGLQGLRRGQILDRDPTTGIEIAVADVGREAVALRETGALHQAELVYDLRTGILVRSEFESYTPLVTTRISLGISEWP